MYSIKNRGSSVLTVFCLLVSVALGSQGATVNAKKAIFTPHCKEYSNGNMDKSISKLKGARLSEYGMKSPYYKLNAGDITTKQDAVVKVTSGIIKEGTINFEMKSFFDYQIKLEDAGAVPKMLACEIYLNKNEWIYLIAFEEVTPLSTKAGRDKALANLTKTQALFKILKAIKKFNDAGYYHNGIRAKTIAADSTGELKLYEWDYAVVKNANTRCMKNNGLDYDPPSLFSDNGLQKDTDDMYPAILFYVELEGRQTFDHFFAGIGENPANSCEEKRDTACIEAIASRMAVEIEPLFGAISPAFKTSNFAFAHGNWANLNKQKAFENLTVGALLHGLLNQHKFQMDAKEFMDTYEYLMNNSGRRILV